MIENFKRLEKKWIFKNIDKETLTQNLINYNLYFRTQFNERFVNSIYFDSPSLRYAEDNLAGISNTVLLRSGHLINESDSKSKYIVDTIKDSVSLIKN